MLSIRYESTKVDRKIWLHLPSVTLWSSSCCTQWVVEIQKEHNLHFIDIKWTDYLHIAVSLNSIYLNIFMIKIYIDNL